MDDFYNNKNGKRKFPKFNKNKMINKILSGNYNYEDEEYQRIMEEMQKKKYQKEILDQQIRIKNEIERNKNLENEYNWPQNINFRNNFNHNNYRNLENNCIIDRTHSPLITTGQQVIGRNQIINNFSIYPNDRLNNINININNNIRDNNNDNHRINIGNRLNNYNNNNTISNYNNNNNSINFDVENNFSLDNTNFFGEKDIENQRISNDINNGFFETNRSYDENNNRPFREIPIDDFNSSNLNYNEESNYNGEPDNNNENYYGNEEYNNNEGHDDNED